MLGLGFVELVIMLGICGVFGVGLLAVILFAVKAGNSKQLPQEKPRQLDEDGSP